jgi:general secretion pathway protein G
MLRRGRQIRNLGFSVIELMIAMAILALIVGIAVPMWGSYTERAKVAKAVVAIRMIEGAVERYRVEFKALPNQIDPLLKPAPLDPWGNPYQYLNLQTMKGNGTARKDKNLVPLNSDYDLYSMGADGASRGPLNAPESHDDVLRANDGKFVGLAANY